MIASRIIFFALLSGLANALPHHVRDSSTNEPAVSAPNGTPITESAQPMPTSVSSGGSYGGSNMGYGGSNTGYGGSNMGSSGGEDSMDQSGGSSMGWNAGMDSMSSMDAMTTMDIMSTSTSTASSSYQTPAYGSGSSNWGSSGSSSGYDDCVSQCMAQYGSPSQSWTPPPTQTSSDNSSSGTGATHTVIVAPSAGVFRYVPFAVNASVGDTVKFVWKAGPHTVTKSSELTPCNKTSTAPFSSGTQMVGATFTQVVNDTNPTFYYCGVPNHCQQGMFGIINPPSAANAGTSVSMMMSNWTASNSDLSAYAAMTSNMTQGNVAAGNWGGNIDSKNLPSWSYTSLAENVMYSRLFLAANPEVLKEDGTIDLSNAESTPLMFPQDISQVLSNAGTSAGAGSATAAAPANAAAPAASPETSSTAGTPSANASNTNGAMTTSPKFAVALAAAAASLLLL